MPLHDWTRVSAGTYHDFHGTWIVELKRRLNQGILPPGYYAMGEQIAGSAGPDVLTLQEVNIDEEEPPQTEAGGVAIAVAPPKVFLYDKAEDDLYVVKRRTLVIRHSSEDRVVALIEILSPGNKSSRHAIESLVNKVSGVLRKGLHVLVIDPFPPTPRDPQGIHPLIWGEFVERPFALPPGKSRTLASYAAGVIKQACVQPVGVGEDLPDMPLFLNPETYINVPLESTYRAAFDAEPMRWRKVLEA
jgi:hypothetical protein